MFTSRKIDEVPVRTYGWLNETDDGTLRFEYRPWLILPRRQLDLPRGSYVVGKGLLYPEVARLQGDEMESMLTLPPRYCTHEQELSDAYGFDGVRDVGLRKWFKAFVEMVGLGKKESSAAPGAV